MNDPKDYLVSSQVEFWGKHYWWGRPRTGNGPLRLFKRTPKIRIEEVFSTLLNEE